MQHNKKELNIARTHTVGRFLNENPEAKKIVVGNRRNTQRAFFHIGPDNRMPFNGGVRRGSTLGRGAGFDISCKARAA
ncbi:hypothetical protein [Burkholderia cenocepacia]|uniref:hypothetical protein n=1 Tax=Burkholderia cenocepacia TaxID=95486 RepID=UPI00097BC0B7|nr:hypothetical protein [Burkholderia cenocepacia]AQQ19842.1 hypothetical protein A8D61_15805 [Burkholderia cenocepacia]MBO1859382.1 hypothetical protein [Burkholderia cenocepacia]MDR5647623.1 hypothetical protein [Burkholderia cenocepacia]ONJ19588.1 hypothetical protein A8D82_11745 [Burkholderia cenocepacia]ONN80235.1 hypothetical protein A8D63_31345 [Burkholderia cenocepacia]